MQNIEQFVKRVMTYNVTVALLTGVGCCIGALVVLVKKINSHREMKEKIERARNRRDESLQQAEEVVLQYKQSHPTTDAAFIMSLSLSELTKQLKEGSLSPEDVLYSYIEKTLAVNKKLNCCTEILLESLDQLKTVGSNKEGLLYGVPVSIKENVAVKIYRSAKPLRIGYLENNGYMQPFPSMARGIREIKALLEQAGHTLVLYHPLKIAQIFPELLVKSLFADGCTTLQQKLKGEPLDPIIKEQFFIYFLPKWLKKILSFLLKPVSPPGSAIMSALCGVRSVLDLWKHHAAVEDYIHETIAHWRSYNIDVLLCPVPGPAYNASYCGRIPTLASCTVLYNLLNFPVGVVPVSTVTAEDEEELNHQQMLSKPFKAAMSGGEGLPVAVQCVALPWQDELCLRFMKELEQLVKQKKK